MTELNQAIDALNLTPDTDPALWAVRATGMLYGMVGRDMLEGEALELVNALLSMVPLETIVAAAEVALTLADTQN